MPKGPGAVLLGKADSILVREGTVNGELWELYGHGGGPGRMGPRMSSISYFKPHSRGVRVDDESVVIDEWHSFHAVAS